MSENKEPVEAIINMEDVVEDGELTDADLDKVAGGNKAQSDLISKDKQTKDAILQNLKG